MNDFYDDAAINRYRLDEELTEQPQKFYEWAKAEVIAGNKVTEIKDKLEVLKAKIEIRIRKNPTLFDLPDNPKEGLIKASIIVQPKVKRLQRKLIEAMKTHRLLQKAEKSMEHRKKSLEGLVSVNMQMHFASPRQGPKKDLQAEMAKENLLDEARKKKRRIKRR